MYSQYKDLDRLVIGNTWEYIGNTWEYWEYIGNTWEYVGIHVFPGIWEYMGIPGELYGKRPVSGTLENLRYTLCIPSDFEFNFFCSPKMLNYGYLRRSCLFCILARSQ